MKSSDYVKVLEEHILPLFVLFPDNGFIFQQDNASIHTSRETMDWLKQYGIEVLEWPACSPDLNPIENLWEYLVKVIYAENRQYQSVNELKTAILTAWNNIPQEIIQNLINSMPNRIFQVIQCQGRATDY